MSELQYAYSGKEEGGGMVRMDSGKKVAAAFLKGLVLAEAVSFSALLLLAFLLLKLQPDTNKIEIGIMVIYVLACFAGGWYCGKKMERKKFLWGMLLGVLYFMLLAAVSGMSDKMIQASLAQGMLAFGLCAAGGMLGGMVAG